MATRNIIHGQLALLFGEGPVLPMPANGNSMPPQNGACLRREKTLVLLIRSVDTVPRISGLAVAVGDAIEAIEDTPVMWGMNLGVVRQSVGDDPVALWRIEVVEDFVGSDSTCRCGLVETLIVVGQDRPLAENEIGVMVGLI